jgi:hypothetical protein
LFQTPKLGESFTYSVNGPTNVLPEKMGRLYPMYIVKHRQKFTGVSGAALFFLAKNSQIAPKIFVWPQVHLKKRGENSL